jgi:hypothetical protein
MLLWFSLFMLCISMNTSSIVYTFNTFLQPYIQTAVFFRLVHFHHTNI